MTEQEILALLREACGRALRRDMRGYGRLMERADAEIERVGNPGGLRGEYLVASSFGCGREWTGEIPLFREALRLLGGPSRLFPRGSHLFADYYNVFAICNTEPGHADENADKLTELTGLFYRLNGGGLGTDICYRAQLAFYRGDIDAALPLARKAFDAARSNGQSLVALCAAETLLGVARHRQDIDLWRYAARYIDGMAQSADAGDRAVREQAGLQRCMRDLSLGFLHSAPDWIRNGDFGVVSAPWGWELTGDGLLAGSAPNAMLVRIQYCSYSGDAVRALLIADAMQKVYGMSDVLLNVYLDFFRAGCHLQLGDSERAGEALESAVKTLAPDGLWLIAAEFLPAFNGLLYAAAEKLAPEGARRIRELGEDYWRKLSPFQQEILRGRSVGLTRREREISALLLQGKSNAEIAKLLFIGERTVKGHVTNIFRKYNIYRRGQLAEAVRMAKEPELAFWTK